MLLKSRLMDKEERGCNPFYRTQAAVRLQRFVCCVLGAEFTVKGGAKLRMESQRDQTEWIG